jgi:AraC family transcriptional regulator
MCVGLKQLGEYRGASVSAAAWTPSVRLVRYAPGSAIAAHSHAEASLTVLVAGHFQDNVRGRADEHRSGCALFYPAHETHAQRFSAQGALKVQIALSAAAVDFLGQQRCLGDAPCLQSAAIADLGVQLAAELRRGDECSSLVVEGLALETLGRFARAAQRTDVHVLPWLCTVRDRIDARAGEEVAIDELARLAGRHPVHLSRAFRQAFGLSVGDYARSARVRRAAQMLAAGRQPIGEIALECGFCDQAHLSRVFKLAYGTTPAAYRRAAH